MKAARFTALMITLWVASTTANQIQQAIKEAVNEELSSLVKEMVVEMLKDVKAELGSIHMELSQHTTEQDLIKAEMFLNSEALKTNTMRSAPEGVNQRLGSAAEVNYHHTAIGCKDQVINLSCSDNRNISLVNATYGYYAFECGNTCCPPSPSSDCTGFVNASHPEDWAYLVHTCENKPSCNYEYKGASVDQCDTVEADYMQIFYGCFPEVVEPVGFSAYKTVSEFRPLDSIIHFDSIISNMGGHYNPDASSFVCPYQGVYFLSMNFNSDTDDAIEISIIRDSEVLVRAVADYATIRTTGSAFIVVDCGPSQIVWVKTASAGTIQGHNRKTHFTGYLLHMY